jgi:hypothetical protein
MREQLGEPRASGIPRGFTFDRRRPRKILNRLARLISSSTAAHSGFQVHPTQNQRERRISPGQRPRPRPGGPAYGAVDGPDDWLRSEKRCSQRQPGRLSAETAVCRDPTCGFASLTTMARGLVSRPTALSAQPL